MIYVQVFGRCGNQLFQYAVSQRLKQIYNDKCCYNFFYIHEGNKRNSTIFNNLEEFNLENYAKMMEPGNLVFKHGNNLQKVIYAFFKFIFSDKRIAKWGNPRYWTNLNKWQPFLNRFGIYYLSLGNADLKMCKHKNKFVFGTFENPKYCEDIKEQLQREFTPKDTSGIDADFLNAIKNSNSVCISIRRGDFWSDAFRGERAICDRDYFERAIEKMQELEKGCTLIFFSDDISWAKEQFQERYAGSYFESGNNSTAEKLFLMSSCKHFILSNSTFSWWAQFLSKSENKVVISPDRWMNYENFKHSLIDDSWIFIKTNKIF